MATVSDELDSLFAINAIGTNESSQLSPDISNELQSILRLHALSPQELSYKWESYTMRMGSESTRLDLDTAIAFKKDLQEQLEREVRSKQAKNTTGRSNKFATPKSVTHSSGGRGSIGGDGDDIMAMVEGTPSHGKRGMIGKRKVPYETTPGVPKYAKGGEMMNSPSDARNGDVANVVQGQAFAERQNAGQLVETLNDHLPTLEAAMAPPAEPRVKITANTDLKKFYYKPMAMHLSEASEILDDRIDEFQAMIQSHHQLDDSCFGSAAIQSTNETIAVGRIACDTLEGRLNAASIVLEMSRRAGAGMRVPLRLDSLSCAFFPGQIVAVRGINASGNYFSVTEVLEAPLPPPVVSAPSALQSIQERAGITVDNIESGSSALNVMIASGPYTADDNLAFEPLKELCRTATETYADVLVLIGPFLDVEHPLLATGEFDLPDDANFEPDKATLDDVFRILIGTQLRNLVQHVPSVSIVLIPSVRDAVNKHVSWPQEPFDKKVLGLPKQARVVTNPVTISLNETLVGISASDVLWDLRREEVVIGKPKETSLLARLPRHLIEQRHFYPIFPPSDRASLPQPSIEDRMATGMPLDTSYLKLGEWVNARPDLLITPSMLSPFAKVVESVLVVNPGSLSKRKGPGTYAQMAIYPRKISAEEESAPVVGHHLFERARVDIVRI